MSRSPDVATRRPIRPWVSVIACGTSAVLAFALGRASAPGGGSPGIPANSARIGTEGPAHVLRGDVVHPGASKTPPNAASAARLDPLDPVAQKQAEIIALLNNFKNSKLHNLGPELLHMITWVGAAGEDDLALFTALGKEILTGDDMHDQLVLPLAFTRWTDLNAPAAFAAYLELDEGDRSSELSKIIFGGWMRQGAPNEALDHALALQRTGDAAAGAPAGYDFVGDLLEDLVKSNPAQAGAILDEFARSSDPLEREAASHGVDDLVNELADHEGPTAALERINGWPDQGARAELRQKFMNHLLNGDPEQQRVGMEMFMQMPEPDTGIVASIARQKTTANMAAAQSWMQTLPTGEARRAALNGIVETLDNQNKIKDMLPWLSARPPHADYDSAYRLLARSTFQNREDFPAAMQFAERVVDPQNATQLKSELIVRWLNIDQENAVRVLGPEMEKAMLVPPR